MASVYVEGGDTSVLDDACDHLRKAVAKVRRDTGAVVEVMVVGDFNRHDQLWGGDEVSLGRQGEADLIIDLMNEFTLSSLLKRDSMIKCAIHGTEYGSDHRAIETVFDAPWSAPKHQERLLLKNAPWNEINARIASTLTATLSGGTVQQKTDRLMTAVSEAVHALTPKAKPLPHAKRWWTADLTQLRYIYTYWRNHARSERRAGRKVPHLEKTAQNNDNIWKAAKYLKSGEDAAFGKLPQLVRADGTTTTDYQEQAEELLSKFFPPLPDVINDKGTRPQREPVEAFCSERTATIQINGQVSEVQSLPQAGLPQGSPLSPILFLFFNTDLVQRQIDSQGGAIAFVDDFTAWVTGLTAQSNREGIKAIINKALDWEKRSGATFEADKTAIIHFAPKAYKLDQGPFTIKGQTVEPKDYVKILGVLMDTKLKYKEHIARAASKGLEAAMELRRLRGLSPATARQLFTSTVAPVVDYASNVWIHAYKDKAIGPINRVQRVGAQAIVGTFLTVATSIAEAEAYLTTIQHRF
ncbi:hypothetical protein PEX2_061100 [Penicillium expansum]|uniref:Reverse transcriptase domain-containing protein n=1 Tax=Penicillium expansum TaxID=27334 RepID=A0A0A2JDK4_PENEN|nr:hypothetical protein PEX2_061100 [Penicillium expansum]KGO53502.1 hypothetical protein PEX2_061100 [Penicillium expansum]